MKLLPFFLVSISLLFMNKGARAGPIEEPMATPFPTATVTSSPTPTNTASPSPTPTTTPTVTITPTPDAVSITASHKVNRCLLYESIVRQWIALEPPEFHVLDESMVNIVLAIGAAETGCENHLIGVDGNGSIGIWQVIPKSWTAPAEMLWTPSVGAYWAMWILDRTLEKYGGDMHYALSLYNCSKEKVDTDMCGPYGGRNYADQVLDFWLPLIEKALE